jgi:hypothetical protein
LSFFFEKNGKSSQRVKINYNAFFLEILLWFKSFKIVSDHDFTRKQYYQQFNSISLPRNVKYMVLTFYIAILTTLIPTIDFPFFGQFMEVC